MGIVVITQSQLFFDTTLGVLNDIKEHVFDLVELDAEFSFRRQEQVPAELYQETKFKAIEYFRSKKRTMNIQLIQANSVAQATEKVINNHALYEGETFQVGMLYYDHASVGREEDSIEIIDEQLLGFYQALSKAYIPFFHSFFSTVTFIKNTRRKVRHLPQQYREVVRSETTSALQTELLYFWMDFYEMNYLNRRVKPRDDMKHHNTLGEQLLEFLSKHANQNWLGLYYTGSIVSNLIGYVDREAPSYGGTVLRGANEHSLACGALANWQLYQKPFLIIVTSAMVDEFKGTLTNLKEASAQGFIIVAESCVNQWYSFQSTITSTEDTREVLTARGIPFVYMSEVEEIEQDLEQAFEYYHQANGPVILLVTQKVLNAVSPLNHMVCDRREFGPAEKTSAVTESTQVALDKALALLNEGPDKVVWQLGALDQEEVDLVQSVAERAGIALVDSLAYPGSAQKYINGKLNANYLGTLSIYGLSPRVYSYLYTNNQLNPKASQCLFFIKSRVAQICTPFTESRLKRKLNVVQLTHNPAHMAPFTDLPLMMDCKTFLHYISDNLRVDDELRKKRLSLMMAYYDSQSDIVSKLPMNPMSPNYFFSELNNVLEDLIVTAGYDYTGIYDVGRCGISAIINLSRTRRGFSGWYGRALMGDALLSSIFLAHTSPSNVIAFIGDGAKDIVPDILPSFIDNLLTHPETLNKNITVMYFCNGGLSLINTYQERLLFNRTSKQMRLMNLHQEEWEETINQFKVVAKTITNFNAEEIAQSLTEPRRLNLFSVVVNHNNEGDGITLATTKGWQRSPELPLDVRQYITADEPNQTMTEN
ncbi:biosynthesis protein PigD [Photobacterium lipolyticum]|uniref:Biosynthesis protein PigD n=2 Tax=Photobacterium lipolyticum TaxID=266810 RepID=A0A2T3MZD1_9GAMM|nr:biosynthesis protein PigD [Photobacterium lipolyticum]